MSHKPVIAVDEQGNKTYYSSRKAAAAVMKVASCQITYAVVTDRLCHGFHWRDATEREIKMLGEMPHE